MKTKLPPKFKSKWLKALRSGEYKQGTGELLGYDYGDDEEQRNPKYCCLGVACRVAGHGRSKINGEGFITSNLFNTKSGLPQVLFGDEDNWGNDIPSKLSKMNDDKKMSFKEIANWIEKNL